MKLFNRSADVRADVPVIQVPEGFDIPPKTQWAFTPSLQDLVPLDGMSGTILTGTELGQNVSLHHGAEGECFRIERPDDYGHGLIFDFDGFSGDFFSLAFALPEAGVLALGRQDLLRFALRTESDTTVLAYARLNLCHGPNTEQIVRMIEIGDGESFAEFDIFYTELDQKRATNAWVDLIINAPSNYRVLLQDVTLLRRARASL